MDVEALMDLAITVVRDTFGRAVSYVVDGEDAVELTAEFTPADQFVAQALGGNDTGLPRIEVRTSDLVEADITPTAGTRVQGTGDAVTLEVAGVTRTYRVAKVEQRDVGTTVLHLAAREDA